MIERRYFHDLFGGEAELGNISEYAILVNDPLSVEILTETFENRVLIADHYEFRVVTGVWKSISITVCSTGLGGGSTSIAADNLVNLGAKTLLYVDSGDPVAQSDGMFTALGAIRCDGVSLDYVRPEFPASADPELLMAVIAAGKNLGVPITLALMAASAKPLSREDLQEYQPSKLEPTTLSRNYPPAIIATGPEVGTLLTLGTLYRRRVGAIYAGATSFDEVGEGVKVAFYLALRALEYLHQWDVEKVQNGWKIITPPTTF